MKKPTQNHRSHRGHTAVQSSTRVCSVDLTLQSQNEPQALNSAKRLIQAATRSSPWPRKGTGPFKHAVPLRRSLKVSTQHARQPSFRHWRRGPRKPGEGSVAKKGWGPYSSSESFAAQRASTCQPAFCLACRGQSVRDVLDTLSFLNADSCHEFQ